MAQVEKNMYRILAFSIILLILEVKSMYLPDDVEVLDSFIDSKDDSSPEYYPDSYYELKSLSSSGLTKAIRNKRSVFVEDQENVKKPEIDANQNESFKNENNSDGVNVQVENRRRRSGENNLKHESLPIAEKQTYGNDQYHKNGWNIQTIKTDYNYREDDDLVDLPSNNEGIKGRTPRVNFITQQKSTNNNIDQPVLPELLNTKSKYQKIEPNQPPHDFYPSRSYDPYLRRYDRYDEFDPYYENHFLYRKRYDPYDSYSPRSPSYLDRYNVWPDRRYDLPEPRDYRQLFSNSIYDDNPIVPPPPVQPRRRIIYYAHLPEIIRNPPAPRYDLNYRYRFDNNYIGPVSGAYTNAGNNDKKYFNREKKDYRSLQSSELVDRGNPINTKSDQLNNKN